MSGTRSGGLSEVLLFSTPTKNDSTHSASTTIHLKDGSPFAFAGLWERWKRREQAINSCSIIVTEPNAVLEPIHDRMPVILSPHDYGLWLDPNVKDGRRLQSVLRPYPADEMEAYPVSKSVNNPRDDVGAVRGTSLLDVRT